MCLLPMVRSEQPLRLMVKHTHRRPSSWLNATARTSPYVVCLRCWCHLHHGRCTSQSTSTTIKSTTNRWDDQSKSVNKAGCHMSHRTNGLTNCTPRLPLPFTNGHSSCIRISSKCCQCPWRDLAEDNRQLSHFTGPPSSLDTRPCFFTPRYHAFLWQRPLSLFSQRSSKHYTGV